MDNQLSTTALIAIAAVGGVGALLGALITSLFNLLNDRAKARREHGAWLREKRWDSFASVISHANHLCLMCGTDQWKEQEEAVVQYTQALDRAMLVTPPKFVPAIATANEQLLQALAADDSNLASKQRYALHKLLVPLIQETK